MSTRLGQEGDRPVLLVDLSSALGKENLVSGEGSINVQFFHHSIPKCPAQ